MTNCSCGHNHIQANAGKSPEPMALRLDPTRTTTLRQKMLADVTRRFKALVQEINKIVIDDDCFGLVQTNHQLQFNAENQFKFTRSADKVKGFMQWLDEMQAQKILTVVTKPGRIGSAVDQAWTDVYIDSAYQQGIRRAGQEMKKGGMEIPIPAGMPGRDPVALAFSSPTHADRVGLIYTRVFNELKGITNAMDQQISSILAQGLAEGRNPQQIASLIKGRVEGIGLARARTLARTEIVRAHHMASIQEYRNAGLVGVSVKSEWLTAGFNVCEKCLELAKGGDIGNSIYSLDKIEGMIPAHPSCRCCALPYMEGVSPKPNQGDFIDSAEEIKNSQLKLEDTSQMPLSMSGNLKNINNPKYRAWIEETVEEEKQTQEVMPEIDKLFEYATDPKYALKQEQKVYFGLNGDQFKNMSLGDEVYSFGTRSTSFTLKRAEAYSRGGGVFEVNLPKETQAVYSKVFDIKELMLLPGSKFEVVSTSNGIHSLKLIDDGSAKVKEVYDWQKKLDKLAEK